MPHGPSNKLVPRKLPGKPRPFSHVRAAIFPKIVFAIFTHFCEFQFFSGLLSLYDEKYLGPLKFPFELCCFPRNRVIPYDGIDVSLKVPAGKWPKECGGEGQRIRFLEHVELQVNLSYSPLEDLHMELLSPDGTVSNMTRDRPSGSAANDKKLPTSVIMTMHFWGETPEGTWRLKLGNSQGNDKNAGRD